jgi:hypothetical protein
VLCKPKARRSFEDAHCNSHEFVPLHRWAPKQR